MPFEFFIIPGALALVVLIIYLLTRSEGSSRRPLAGHEHRSLSRQERLKIGGTYRVKVDWIADGDTIKALWNGYELPIRLYGIDAPENEQLYGFESTKALQRMIGKNYLMLEIIDVDKYDRIVGILFYKDKGRFKSINLRMVRSGNAYAYLSFGGKELGLKNAENRARQERLGVWQDSPQGGERPWAYRRQQHQAYNA